MFFSPIKEINRLIIKIMSSIYLKLKWTFSKLRFIKFSLWVSFWRAPTHADIIEFSNFMLQLKTQRSEFSLFCIFNVSLSTLIRVTPFKTRMFWMFRTRAVNYKHKIRPLHETGLTLAKPWLLRTCHQKVTILLFMRKIFKNWWLNSANIAMVFWFP